MNKEQYIKAREANSIEILYEYYKERFEKDKHGKFFGPEQFVESIQLYPFINQYFEVSTAYYDAKFNILKVPLMDKTLFI